MIRKLAALAAGCALACLASSAALAASVTGTVAPGAVSSSLAITANTAFSISAVAPVSTGTNLGACFTVERSQDNVVFTPLARDAVGTPAHYCGPITIDLTESRSGTYYAIQADPGGTPVITYRIDQ